MKILTLLLLLIASFSLSAQTVFSWTAPTEYTDNSPLPENELDKYVVNIACDGGLPAEFDVNAPTTSFNVPLFIIGDCDFKVKVLSINNGESVWSNTVNKVIKNPKPPTAAIVN